MPTWLWSRLALRVCPQVLLPGRLRRGPATVRGCCVGAVGPAPAGGHPDWLREEAPRRSPVLVISCSKPSASFQGVESRGS